MVGSYGHSLPEFPEKENPIEMGLSWCREWESDPPRKALQAFALPLSYPGASLDVQLLFCFFLNGFRRRFVFRRMLPHFLHDLAQGQEDEEHQQRSDDRFNVQAHADRHADGGDDPKGRGRGQPDDGRAILFEQDRARAQEADAGHDLSGDARRIDGLKGREQIDGADRHEREQARAQADHDVRPEPCRLAVEFPFHPDQGRKYRGQEQPDDDAGFGDVRGKAWQHGRALKLLSDRSLVRPPPLLSGGREWSRTTDLHIISVTL